MKIIPKGNFESAVTNNYNEVDYSLEEENDGVQNNNGVEMNGEEKDESPSDSSAHSIITSAQITTTTTHGHNNNKTREKCASFLNNVGPIVFVLWISCLIGACIFLAMGYNSTNDAQGAKAEDFVNIGERCRIESIQYRTHTTSRAESRKSSSTTIYECDETWRYAFVVLLEEEKGDNVQQQDSSIDTSYSNSNGLLHSVLEENRACDYKPCSTCPNLMGKYVLNDGNFITEGSSFVTGCWSHKKAGGAVAPHPFWECSESSINLEGEKDNAACYLLSNPQDVLNEYLESQRTYILIGWMLFIPFALLLGIFIFRPFARGALKDCWRMNYRKTNV